MEDTTKEQIGLLVTMKAKPGKEEAVRDFLLGGLSLVNEESGTESWYAFQIDESTFGIFDTFSNDQGRKAHLEGEVAKALLANADDLLEDFDVSVSIQPVDLLATKLAKEEENKGLLVIMKAKEGKTSEVEDFLLAGKKLVNDEPKTVSWYAIKINSDTYAIFDTFAEDAGRDAHLNGKVAAALMENAPVILDNFDAQAIQMIDILALK
ncbi:MAG: putative quinol monooxygenase [Ekhidna sp.]